ncbi:galactose-1-phosphate uridylyltransferase [Candidatus Poribacteria bacterium]|nr:galactose-1-phosphate uridylyltransferase [Candidatus Poribacteria bacterium]
MSELRKDPIVGRWVIVAPERSAKPREIKQPQEERGKICVLCEGNESNTPSEILAFRNPGTAPNSPGWQVRVVPNKFPVLRVEGELGRSGVGIFDMMNGIGAHEVIIESPSHELDLAFLPIEQIAKVLKAYQARMIDLANDRRLRYTLLFKNQGERAGASLAHPHTQLMALPITPILLKEELIGAKEHFNYKERCIFCDIIRQERELKSRVISEMENFITIAPYASRFPFEMWILPSRHNADFMKVNNADIAGLAKILKDSLLRLAKALSNPAFNYIIHTAPYRRPRHDYWTTIDEDYHWHIEIMPRVTTPAGFEWGTGFYINPTAPEDAAQYLREEEI